MSIEYNRQTTTRNYIARTEEKERIFFSLETEQAIFIAVEWNKFCALELQAILVSPSCRKKKRTAKLPNATTTEKYNHNKQQLPLNASFLVTEQVKEKNVQINRKMEQRQ